MINFMNDNKDKLNIKLFAHNGDLIEWPRTKDWLLAQQGLLMLVIMWLVSLGNHDDNSWNGSRNVSSTSNWQYANKYISYDIQSKQKGFVDSFPKNTINNTAYEFQGGGLKWLALALAYVPEQDEIAWANEVVAKHPSHKVIITTHDYMVDGGGRSGSGQELWDKLVKTHKNIFMVLCGHIPTAAHRIDKGEQGNTVYQFLADYQNYTVREPNSYLRLLKIDVMNKTIDVKTYSPAFNKYLTDRNNQFTLTDIQI